ARPGGRPPFTPRMSRSGDGRIWFVTENVVQVVDPANLHLNETPPPVRIEAITADGKEYLLSDKLDLPALTRDLDLQFTALSFAVPQKVRFRYKLEGRDADFRDPSASRQAFYNDLSPGPYTFRVIAANNDGVWNESGAALHFRIAPAYYQTYWFRGLLSASLLALCWIGYRLRMRQVAAGLGARFDERLTERTRIARELHDTLLQTIQASKMIADTAIESYRDEPRSRASFERISSWLLQATHEGRAALTSLRESTVQENDLAQALQLAGEECVFNRPTTFHLALSGEPRDLHPMVRDDVYRIGHEAIRNACSHSKSPRVEVHLSYGRDLMLRVRDFGKGLDPAVASAGRPGHFGLEGMRERASRTGGKLTIHAKEPGTEVELLIPGHVGFRSRKSVLRPFRARIRLFFE
ncbi:MAG: triple tyrosine motif-containing protein, partial [Bryobacteraceae bacterium]